MHIMLFLSDHVALYSQQSHVMSSFLIFFFYDVRYHFTSFFKSILPKGFIVHNPHEESKAKKVWNDVQDYKLHETIISKFENSCYVAAKIVN